MCMCLGTLVKSVTPVNRVGALQYGCNYAFASEYTVSLLCPLLPPGPPKTEIRHLSCHKSCNC